MENENKDNNEVASEVTVETKDAVNPTETTETAEKVEMKTAEGATPIQLESTSTTLAPRPWRLGAIQVPKDDGKVVWVAAIIDNNGNPVCCGNTVDIEFILKLENSYDQILKAINTSGMALADAVEVLQDFECKKTKAFRFN